VGSVLRPSTEGLPYGVYDATIKKEGKEEKKERKREEQLGSYTSSLG